MKRRDFLNNCFGGCFGGCLLPLFGSSTGKKTEIEEPKIHIEEIPTSNPKPKVISNLPVILTDSTIMNCSFVKCEFGPLTSGFVFCNTIGSMTNYTTIKRRVKPVIKDICFEGCVVDIDESSLINCFIDCPKNNPTERYNIITGLTTKDGGGTMLVEHMPKSKLTPDRNFIGVLV